MRCTCVVCETKKAAPCECFTQRDKNYLIVDYPHLKEAISPVQGIGH